MTLRSTLFVGLALAFLPSLASAAVFERDWKVNGDGLLTYDDVNQREWLDVTQSLLINLGETDVEGSFSFDFDRDVLPELLAGGMFEGFTVAESEDVYALAESAGINTYTFDFVTNQTAVSNLINLLEPTAFTNFLVGVLDEHEGQADATAFLFVRNDSAGLITGIGAGLDGIRYPNTGVMLFREAIPEPMSVTLGCIYILLLFIMRYQ